jgi:hypothetical protein
MIRSAIAILAVIVLSLFSVTEAQQFLTPYAPSFHSAPGSTTFFQFDLNDSTFTASNITHELLYRDSISTSWLRTSMSLMYQACTTFTYSGSINYTPPSGAAEYCFRSENDTAVVSMSAKNTANTFPAPLHLLADMGADPAGDAAGAAGSFLDLTGMQMGYSDTKIYTRLTNVSGGFPTNSGLTFFMYGVGVISPDETDSVGYAMVYINVPFIMTSGLYRINPVDTSFTKIGNISTNITGNALSMSCNISDLTAQPGFGPWPPASGFILTAPMTATQTTSGFTTNDVGKSGLFLPSSHYLRFGTTNTPPVLSDKQMNTSSNHISARITYSDANNDLPTLRELVFASEPHELTACEKNYQIGSVFTDTFSVSVSGWYSYFFRFSDGKDTVSTPIDSVHVQLAMRGDANGSGGINISDAVFMITYIFSGGPAPNPLWAGDPNCDGAANISDAVYLIAYIFAGGSPPCP